MSSEKNALHQEDAFSLRLFVISLFGVVIVIATALLIANFFHLQRKQQVISLYATETVQFVESNKEAITKLYSNIFPECQAELDAVNAASKIKNPASYYSSNKIKCTAAKQHLDTLQAGNQIKDSSATYFVVWEQPDKVITIDASGEYYIDTINGDRWSSTKEYWEFFHQSDTFKADWADFSYRIPQKEVLVPVELPLNHPSFILRGVIEK